MEAQTQPKIIKLPFQFTQRGDQFTRVFETDDFYIYQRNHSNVEYFEVFKRKTVRCFDFETLIPTGEHKEVYPRDESFGLWAWCCRSLERAMEHIKSKA